MRAFLSAFVAFQILLITSAASGTIEDKKKFELEKVWHTFSVMYFPKGENITLIRASWTVPPAPIVSANQSISIWIGMEPEDSAFVLQPVLRWKESKWMVSCWGVKKIGYSFPAVQTKPLSVEPGTKLTSFVELVSVKGGTYNYRCGFEGYPGTEMAFASGERLNSVWVEYETHKIETCLEYTRGMVKFENVEVRLERDYARGHWYNKPGGLTDPLKCGMKVRILKDSTRNGDIEIGIPSKHPAVKQGPKIAL